MRIVEKTQEQPQDPPLRALRQHVDHGRQRRVMRIAEDLPQRGVVAADQQQETLDHLAALVLAVAMDRRLQAAQHVAANHLRVAAVARVAAAGKLFAQGLHQFQRGLGRQLGIGLGRTVQGGQKRGNQVIIAEHHRRPAAVFA